MLKFLSEVSTPTEFVRSQTVIFSHDLLTFSTQSRLYVIVFLPSFSVGRGTWFLVEVDQEVGKVVFIRQRKRVCGSLVT